MTKVVPTLSHFDSQSTQCENEVKRIVHLQSVTNQMLDAFNDASKVIKSHIPAANVPAKMCTKCTSDLCPKSRNATIVADLRTLAASQSIYLMPEAW